MLGVVRSGCPSSDIVDSRTTVVARPLVVGVNGAAAEQGHSHSHEQGRTENKR